MPDPLEQQIATLLRQIQDQSDAEILSTLRAQAGTFASPHRHGWAADVPLTREHFAALREELDRWPLQATPPPLGMSQGDWEDILGQYNPETPNRNGDIFPGGFRGSLQLPGGTRVGTTGGTATPGIGGTVTLTGGSPIVMIPEFEIMSSPLFGTPEVRTRRFDLIDRRSPSPSQADAILDAVVRVKTQTLAPANPTIRGWWTSEVTREAPPPPVAAGPSRTVWELLVEWAE